MGNYMNMEIKDVETAELYMNSQFKVDGELEIYCSEYGDKGCFMRVQYVCDDFTHKLYKMYTRRDLDMPVDDEAAKGYICIKEYMTEKAISLFFAHLFLYFYDECRKRALYATLQKPVVLPSSFHEGGLIATKHDTKPMLSVNQRVINFLKEYTELCKKYNLSLSHQDGEGAFIIENYQEYSIDWVEEADIEVEE